MDTKKRDKTMVTFSFKIETDLGQNRGWKRENVKIHYCDARFDAQNLCFHASKPMVLPPETYGFAPQNLCFYNPKALVLSASI